MQACPYLIIGAYSFAIWTPIAVFAALWGVPFLQEKYQISCVAASGMCSMIWLGIGIGSPLLGWFSDRIESRRIALIISAILGLCSTLVLLYRSDLSHSWAYFVLFVFGLGAGGQTVSFAVVKENNPPELVGTASGFNNLSVLIGGALFQPFVGYMLQHSDSWRLINGVHFYSLASYQNALMVVPICFFASLIIATFNKRITPGPQSIKKTEPRPSGSGAVVFVREPSGTGALLEMTSVLRMLSTEINYLYVFL